MRHRTTITATQMHKTRGEIIKRCFRDKEHFIIERDGIPLVALIPIEHYQAAFPDLQPSGDLQA